MKHKAYILEFLKITLGTAIVAAAVFFFLIPSQLPIGSISSLAMVLSTVIPLRISTITFILNTGLLILGFLFIGREFGGKTVYTSILMPGCIAVFEWIFPDFTSLMGSPVLDGLCYIFVVSIGLAMLFNCNASSGGLDIVAKFLNKFLRMEMGKAMSVSGMCVALSALLVYDAKAAILSMIGTYLNGIMVDHFAFAATEKKRVCILSPKIQEIRHFILENLNSGATVYQAIGAYDMQARQEIITIVNRSEYRQLMDYIAKVDKNAFITVYTVSTMSYLPKVPGKRITNPPTPGSDCV